MTHAEMQSEAHEWLTRFRTELHTRIRGGFIAQVRPVLDELHEVTFGWYTTVAQLEGALQVTFEIWFDTYLNAAGPYHLGCWHETSWTKAQGLIQPLGAAWGVTAPVYHREHREHDWTERLQPQVGKRETSRIPAPFVDHWGVLGYAGLYAVRDPMRAVQKEVLDDSIEALRRLVQVVSVTGGHARSLPDPDDDDIAERQRRVCAVLARPEQQQARRRAFDQHGACLISGEPVPEALEAAHIRPVYAGGTDARDNILLLRADLHRLFDAGLITICEVPKPCVKVARRLIRPGSSYASLATLAENASTISAGQWLALATRNRQWDEDLGLSHIKRSAARMSLLTPSPA